MIREKKSRQKQTVKVKKIALLGTRPGVGVTHTGILLAEFLKERMGAKVAVLELNHHGDMAQLEREVYGYSDTFFSFRGVDYYKEVSGEKIEKIACSSYDYLILDFGTQKKKDQKEIEQGDEKVLIGTLSLWEWQEYIQAVRHFEMLSLEGKEKYAVSFGENKLAARMAKTLKKPVYFLGHQPQKAPLSAQAESFFNALS